MTKKNYLHPKLGLLTPKSTLETFVKVRIGGLVRNRPKDLFHYSFPDDLNNHFFCPPQYCRRVVRKLKIYILEVYWETGVLPTPVEAGEPTTEKNCMPATGSISYISTHDHGLQLYVSSDMIAYSSVEHWARLHYINDKEPPWRALAVSVVSLSDMQGRLFVGASGPRGRLIDNDHGFIY